MDGFDTQARVKNGAPLAGHGARAVKDAIVEAVGFLPEKLSTSVTRTAHGNAERTRTPTAYSVSTFLKELTYPDTARWNSPPSRIP